MGRGLCFGVRRSEEVVGTGERVRERESEDGERDVGRDGGRRGGR